MTADVKPARPRRRLSRTEREQRLIEATIYCISVHGLSDTTVALVARRAEMAAGSISQYFDSKDHLLTATLEFLSEQFATAWRSGLASAGDDPMERLRCFVRCYFQPDTCQRQKIAVWFAFWGEAKARPPYQAVCLAYDQEHDRQLECLCEAVIRDRSLAWTPAALAKVIASTCHGLWLELLTGTDSLDRRALRTLALAQVSALTGHPLVPATPPPKYEK